MAILGTNTYGQKVSVGTTQTTFELKLESPIPRQREVVLAGLQWQCEKSRCTSKATTKKNRLTSSDCHKIKSQLNKQGMSGFTYCGTRQRAPISISPQTGSKRIDGTKLNSEATSRATAPGTALPGNGIPSPPPFSPKTIQTQTIQIVASRPFTPRLINTASISIIGVVSFEPVVVNTQPISIHAVEAFEPVSVRTQAISVHGAAPFQPRVVNTQSLTIHAQPNTRILK